jgi:glycosyltransferase involved in cell wall biosynthesis
MSTPLLSILIPTRNRACYLRHAIQSALNLDDDNIEIIVSENHSEDDSLAIASSFQDKRLKVIQPEKPLPMHENWELLLKHATGDWVYFLGDDDAMMKHCVRHLEYLSSKYPACEAIVSQRAHFYWPGSTAEGEVRVSINFGRDELWKDSKRAIADCLDGREIYLLLPQFYSGGFQRKSLIKRVIDSQGGSYFRSVTPDAYSALMGCVHTAKYLYTPVPMAWVGFSPHRASSAGAAVAKDREKDFWGLFSQGKLSMHPATGSLKSWTFPLVFFEAYISAMPIASYKDFTNTRLFKLFKQAVREFEIRGDFKGAEELAQYLSFSIEDAKRFGIRDRIRFFGDSVHETLKRFSRKINNLYRYGSLCVSVQPTFYFESSSVEQYKVVAELDSIVEEGLIRWQNSEHAKHKAMCRF